MRETVKSLTRFIHRSLYVAQPATRLFSSSDDVAEAPAQVRSRSAPGDEVSEQLNLTMGEKWEVRRVHPTYLIRELRDDTGVTREVWACHSPDAARLTSTQRLDFGHFGPGRINARCNYIVRDSAGHTYASTVIVRDWGRYPIGQESYFLETLDGRRFRMVKWPPAGRATLAPAVKVTPWQTPAGASYVDVAAGEELISALQKA